jgi:hypothetical protein
MQALVSAVMNYTSRDLILRNCKVRNVNCGFFQYLYVTIHKTHNRATYLCTGFVIKY